MITRNRSKMPAGENFATMTVKVQNWLKVNWKQIQSEGWSKLKVCEELGKMFGINYTSAMLRTQLEAWPKKWPRVKKVGRVNSYHQAMILILARAVAQLLDFQDDIDQPTKVAIDDLIERLQEYEKYTDNKLPG